MKKRITISGSTGSVGTQALEVIDKIPGMFDVYALTGGANIDLLSAQIEKYSPEKVCVKNENDACLLSKKYKNIMFFFGDAGLEEIYSDKKNDIVLVAVSGKTGLKPTLKAIENGIPIALANKETLVTAGEIVMSAAKAANVDILPVDSEHSAIFQCLHGNNRKELKNLVITASGGPFLKTPLEEMNGACVKAALAHPRWKMGRKITVDSATLMNKGLEVIEAHHLFGVPYENIKVVIHPQSVLHSAVEFVDGSVVGQMGVPSMHLPVQYAICYPERVPGIESDSFDFAKIASMTFEEPDYDKFPLLKIAIECGKKGGTYPACLNAADEEAVGAFLNGKIGFGDIARVVADMLEIHSDIANPSLDDIVDCSNRVSALTRELIAEKYS